VSDTRVKTTIKRQRCPFCHDDIVPGGENQACHECLTWHHSECWASHGKCVSCGNEGEDAPPRSTFVQVQGDNNVVTIGGRAEAPFDPDVDCSPEDDCFVHDRMNAKARADLYAAHGDAANEMLASMCKRNQPAPAKNSAFLNLVKTVSDILKTPEPTDEVPPGTALVGATCHVCHRTYTRTRGMKCCGCRARKAEAGAEAEKTFKELHQKLDRLRAQPSSWPEPPRLGLEDVFPESKPKSREKADEKKHSKQWWEAFQIITFILAFFTGLVVFIVKVIVIPLAR